MHEVMQRWFDRHAAELVQVSRTLWERPEASEQEHFACRTLSGLMAEHGFTVAALPPAGLDTAFEASWGSGAPHIGFCLKRRLLGPSPFRGRRSATAAVTIFWARVRRARPLP